MITAKHEQHELTAALLSNQIRESRLQARIALAMDLPVEPLAEQLEILWRYIHDSHLPGAMISKLLVECDRAIEAIDAIAMSDPKQSREDLLVDLTSVCAEHVALIERCTRLDLEEPLRIQTRERALEQLKRLLRDHADTAKHCPELQAVMNDASELLQKLNENDPR